MEQWRKGVGRKEGEVLGQEADPFHPSFHGPMLCSLSRRLIFARLAQDDSIPETY